MFIKLNNEIVNTNRISYLNNNKIIFDGYTIIEISEEDYNLLVGELVVSVEFGEKPSRPSQHSELLNTLNTLLGGRGEAKMTTDRKARLTSRLKDFSADELIRAATNLGNDEFMQGANDTGKRYGTIDYLIRTSANVNKWLEDQPQKKKGMF